MHIIGGLDGLAHGRLNKPTSAFFNHWLTLAKILYKLTVMLKLAQ